MIWYITDRLAYINRRHEVGAACRAVMGKRFPAMSVVQVATLVEAAALVEIEVTAVK